jgi:hypothetical protein
VTSAISFEIGAVFLFATLILYASMSGFLSRAFQAGKPAPIILGVFILGLVAYRFRPDLSTAWHSLTANTRDAVTPALTPAPTPSPAAASPARPPTKRPPARWKGTVAYEMDTPRASAQQAMSSAAPAAAALPQSAPDAQNAPLAVKDQSADMSGDSPYDSGLKRAAKRVGRFLHIGRKTQ